MNTGDLIFDLFKSVVVVVGLVILFTFLWTDKQMSGGKKP